MSRGQCSSAIYANMRYERNVSSRHLKLARVSQVLIKLGKVFHRDDAATAIEPSQTLVRVRFTSKLLLLAELSALAG